MTGRDPWARIPHVPWPDTIHAPIRVERAPDGAFTLHVHADRIHLTREQAGQLGRSVQIALTDWTTGCNHQDGWAEQ